MQTQCNDDLQQQLKDTLDQDRNLVLRENKGIILPLLHMISHQTKMITQIYPTGRLQEEHKKLLEQWKNLSMQQEQLLQEWEKIHNLQKQFKSN
jgi:hypothetical protein